MKPFSTASNYCRGRGTDDPDAYGRSCARQRETLDPVMQMRPIPPRLMRALCEWLDAPKLRRAA